MMTNREIARALSQNARANLMPDDARRGLMRATIEFLKLRHECGMGERYLTDLPFELTVDQLSNLLELAVEVGASLPPAAHTGDDVEAAHVG